MANDANGFEIVDSPALPQSARVLDPNGFEIVNSPRSAPAPQLDSNGFEIVRPPNADPNQATISQAPAQSVGERLMRFLSPITGPTEMQKQEDGISWTDPNTGKTTRVYKPLGDAIAREGLISGLSHPAIAIPRADGSDPAIQATMTATLGRQPSDMEANIGAGLYNQLAGFGEFAESPLGIATATMGGAPMVIKRAIAGLFAADIARHVPEAASAAGAASVNGTAMDKVNADLGLASSVILPGLLTSHAAAPEAKPPVIVPDQNADLAALRSAAAKAPVLADGQPSEFGGEAVAAPPATATESPAPAPTPEAPAGEVEDSEDETLPPVQPAPAPATAPVPTPAPTETTVVGAPAGPVPAEQIATRPDLMQFKRMDDTAAGVNAGDTLSGKWDDLKGGNLLLWEPTDPQAYGLQGDEKYIVANGHHRFEFGQRQDVPGYNAQVIREADGYSARDARALAAEINIADGKGTIYDQVKFLRNEAATHGADAALARAGRTGAQGRQAATVAFAAGPDLYDSFTNEKVSPDQAEAIAKAAPTGSDQSEGLQRLGIRKAIDGSSPAALGNLIQAVRLEGKSVAPEQFDLFAADDSAIKTAEKLAGVASRIQGELSKEIRSTDAAAKNATTAKAKGIKFDRPPEEILADNQRLKAERDRWDNWAMHPDMVRQVRDYAEMGRSIESHNGVDYSLALGGPPKRGMSREYLQARAADWEKQLPGAPRINIVQGVKDLPESHRANVEAHLATGMTVKGFYDRATGESYLIADHAPDEDSARDTYFHEVLGHGGMERLLKPGDMANLAEMIQRGDPAEWERIKRLYNYDASERGRNATIKEYVARAASLPERDPWWGGIRDKLVGALGRIPLLRSWLAGPALDARMRALARTASARMRTGELPALPQSNNTHPGDLRLAASLEQNNPRSTEVKPGEGLRAFGQKILGDTDMTDPVKSGVSQYVYEKRANETDAQTAQRLIAAHGVDEAARVYLDDRAMMPGAVRSILGKTLIKTLADHEQRARNAGNTVLADSLVNKQVDLMDHDLKRSTEIAQSLQAMSVYGDMSPQGILRHAKRVFGDAGDKQMEKVQPVAELLRSGFQNANDAATAAVTRDVDVNAAARAAVNEQVAASEATRKAVVVEMSGAMAESPEIVRQAQEALRGQLNRVLLKQGLPVGRLAQNDIAPILNDLAKRVAGIASGHYRGAELGKTLAQKIQERTGLSEDVAQRLAKAMDNRFAKMVEDARKQIPERIAAQRAKQAEPFNPNEVSQPAVDKEIRRQLHDANVKLGQLVQQHSSQVDTAGRSIGDRVVKDAGLTGPAADKLRAVFDKHFNELATAAKRQVIKQTLDAGNKIPAKMKGALDDLIKLTNTGAFDDAKFHDAIRQKMELPMVTPEMSREIVKRANALQQKPEGFLRDRAGVQLLDYVASQKPLKVWDKPMALWYANVLSHVGTPVHILIDNMANLAGNTLTQLVRHPTSVFDVPGALARGFRKGGLQAAEVIKTGVATGIRSRLAASKTLETHPFQGALSLLNYWKYVGRTVSAAHVITFKPAEELRALMVARDVATKEGLQGHFLKQRVADILGNTEARTAAARAQATGEGLKGLDLARRTDEIIEQQREQQAPGIRESANKFARQNTYLNEPYGVIGAITKGLDAVQQNIEGESGVAGTASRTLLPFKHIVGNLINEKLNYTPVGAFRAATALRTGKLYGELADPGAVGDLLAKSALGTAGLTAAWMAVNAGKLTLTGKGPATAEQRRQLNAADGWKPNAIKIGNTYYSYLRTPLAVPLTILANYQDAEKYGGLDKTDLMSRFMFAGMALPDAIVHQSFFKSIGEVLDAVQEQDPKTAGQKMQRTIAQNVASFAVPGLVSDIDRIFDPTQYSTKDVAAIVRSQIPFLRRDGRPTVNALGEPVKTGIFNGDFSSAKPDPLWQMLADKGVWVTSPSPNTLVGNRRGGPDAYRALTPDELYDYTVSSGAKIRGRLEGQLDRLESAPTDRVKKIVDEVTTQERKKALTTFKR